MSAQGLMPEKINGLHRWVCVLFLLENKKLSNSMTISLLLQFPEIPE